MMTDTLDTAFHPTIDPDASPLWICGKVTLRRKALNAEGKERIVYTLQAGSTSVEVTDYGELSQPIARGNYLCWPVRVRTYAGRDGSPRFALALASFGEPEGSF